MKVKVFKPYFYVANLPKETQADDLKIQDSSKNCKKIKYCSKEEAEIALLSTKIACLKCHFRGMKSKRHEKRYYKCNLPSCRNLNVWHLTSQPKRKKKENKYAPAA